MAFWCQKALLVFTIIICFTVSAAQQWQHEQLWVIVKDIDVEQSEKPSSLLTQLENYVEYSRTKKWLDIETLVMSKIATVHGMLEQFDQAKNIVDKYLPIAEKLENVVSQLELIPVLLQYYDNKGDLESAMALRKIYLGKALLFADQKLIAAMYIQVALSKQSFGERKASLVDLNTALKISEKIDYRLGKGAALNSIAIIYDEMKNYQQALLYYKKALKIYESEGESFSLSVLYFNIGHTYFILKNMPLADENLQVALALSQKLNDEIGKGYAYSCLGEIATFRESYAKAHQYFTKAIAIFELSENHRMHFTTLLSFSGLQAKMGLADQAMASLNSLEDKAKTFSDRQYLLDYYLKVYELEKLRKNFSSSLSALEKAKNTQQKMNEKQKSKSLQELMVRFNTKQKDADNQLLQQQNKLKQMQLNEQSAQQTVFILVIVFSTFCLFIISLLLYRQIINRNNFKRMALRDELTGAPNRRAIITIAERRFKQCIEEGSLLTIAMLDIDHFKKFNDSYGHDVGDQVLRIFSDACQASIRNHDRYGRYGGEEWLLVLLDTKESDIAVVFNRLRLRLKEAMLLEGPDMNLQFSLGATQLMKQDSSLSQLIKRADENLYKAKNSGRDQYVVCG